MKRHFRRPLAFLLVFALMLGTLSMFAFAEDAEETAERAFGKRYVEHPGDHTVQADALPGQKQAGSLPSYYNSNEKGYITPIRNQDPYGTCWAHGAIASCEAYMIKHGIPVGTTGVAANTSLDLSEYHLAWFTYQDAYDELGLLAGDRNICDSDYGYLDIGGNGTLASYTLMRWEGLASEQTSALAYSNVSLSGVSSEYAYKYNVAHVRDCIWINTADRNAVKAAIMEYGAGTLGYFHDDYFGGSNGAYCCLDGSYSTNHDVTVVGWDDSYSRYNFTGAHRPSSDGAWIIKNSWGTWYGNNGYMYISYEDAPSLNDTCYFYAVDPVSNYDNNYQYDGTSSMFYTHLDAGQSIANIFQANNAETLQAVAIAVDDANVSYKVQVYRGVKGDPTSGTLVCEQTGVFPYAGYHTVDLNTPVSLNKNERFSVVFSPEWSTWVPVDMTAALDGWIRWINNSRPGTSFSRSYDGTWWDDSDSYGYRIKAYTTNNCFPCGHYGDTYTVNTATCTEAGAETVYCATCNAVVSTTAVAAYGHNLTAWYPVEGTELARRDCTRCDYFETREKGLECHYVHFTDCREGWYHEAVDFAVDNGLMGGVGHHKFDPDGTMTRAMMVTVLYRMVGSPAVDGPSTFSDVPTGQWYSDAISWAQSCGIVGGIGHNRFAPDAPVTREDLATILWRTVGTPETGTDLSAFRDSGKIDGYAYGAMQWAVAEGILNGDAGRLKPVDSATRAEFACIVMRYLKGSYVCMERS